MLSAFLGEIRMGAFIKLPVNTGVQWAYCDGRALKIADYKALFSLLGGVYSTEEDLAAGNFRIPDLQGYLPMGAGPKDNVNVFAVAGVPVGASNRSVYLSAAQIPSHTHPLNAVTTGADRKVPGGGYFAVPDSPFRLYTEIAEQGILQPLRSTALAHAEGGFAHNNLMPSIGVHFIIALTGIFPGPIPDMKPVITSLSPSFGPPELTNKGEKYYVTIAGSGFSLKSRVYFGKWPAMAQSLTSAGLEVLAPAGSGMVYVTVENDGHTSELTAAAQYTYVPSIFDIEPRFGSSAGGTNVEITGSGFTIVSRVVGVYFGDQYVSGRDIEVEDDDMLSVTAPPGSGVVLVRVVLGNGWISAPVTVFSYLPSVSSVSPALGSPEGGDIVEISGNNFLKSTQIYFAGVPATDVEVKSSTLLVAKTPAGTGDATVIATTADGTSTEAVFFSYRPVIEGLVPGFGAAAGGSSIDIVGRNFLPQPSVAFDGTPATITAIKGTERLTVTVPAGTGTAVVTVSTAGGTNAPTEASVFSYAPQVTSVSPAGGAVAGGETVVISGKNITTDATVMFGTSPATVTDTSGCPDKISVTSPAGTNLEIVHIFTTTAGGTSTPTPTGTFTYGLGVTELSPSRGLPDATETVTVTGYGFSTAAGGTTVMFGTTAATNVVVTSSESLTCTAPAGTAAVNVTVTVNGSTSLAGPENLFTYAPVADGLSVATGASMGGTQVTITGQSFSTTPKVLFGGTAATILSAGSTSISVKTPPGNGIVPVQVVTPAGTSPQNEKMRFTYVPSVTRVEPHHFRRGEVIYVYGIGIDEFVSVTFSITGESDRTVHKGAKLVRYMHDSLAVEAPVPREERLGPNGQRIFGPDVYISVLCTNGSTQPFRVGTVYGTAPTITSISPAKGPSSGGTSITISGTGFTGITDVWFGGVQQVIPANVSDTTIVTTTPPGTGRRDVRVENPHGWSQSSLRSSFLYGPALQSADPNPVRIGSTLYLFGYGLAEVTHGTIGTLGIRPSAADQDSVSLEIPDDCPTGLQPVAVENAAGKSISIMVNILPKDSA